MIDFTLIPYIEKFSLQLYFSSAPFLLHITAKERQAYRVLMDEKKMMDEEKKQKGEAEIKSKQMAAKMR